MKLKALGTGSPFCRHPLVPSSFLLQSEDSNVVIGCPPTIPAKLESISLSVNDIDMWIVLGNRIYQCGGLEEVAARCSAQNDRPYLVAPKTVLDGVEELLKLAVPIEYCFETKAVQSINIKEEHYSEFIKFIKVPSTRETYGIRLEESKIYITGESIVHEDLLYRYGNDAELILHDGLFSFDYQSHVMERLLKLPVYIQKKIWIYGYTNAYKLDLDPLPMMYLPQGSYVYDSSRKAKYFSKERFLRENSRRKLGNLKATSPA